MTDVSAPRGVLALAAATAIALGSARVPAQTSPCFIPNVGQWEHIEGYLARAGTSVVRTTEAGWTMIAVDRARGIGHSVSFNLLDGSGFIEHEEQAGGVHHFLHGRDHKAWHTHVHGYRSLIRRSVYDGVDLRLRFASSGHLEYDLLLAPGASLTRCVIEVEGHSGMHVAEDGALVLTTALGDLRQPAPITWEVTTGGERHPVECSYVVLDDSRFTFRVAGRREQYPLVIDPVVDWATFIGGDECDGSGDVAVTPEGDVLVAGGTCGVDFPITPGAFDLTAVENEGTVTKLTADGTSLIFSTHIGGSGDDGVTHMDLRDSGDIALAGNTLSDDFPVTQGAFDTTFAGSFAGGDEFVAVLAADGHALVFASYLGGEKGESIFDFDVASDGAIVVAGQTASADFPTTPTAIQPTKLANSTGFVTKVAPDGASLIFSTFLGGVDFEGTTINAVAAGSDGSVLAGGGTESTSFPVTPNAIETNSGPVFGLVPIVCRISPDGSAFLYSTYLSFDSSSTSGVIGIVEGADGTTLVLQHTTQPILSRAVTVGAYQPDFKFSDALITRIAASGDHIEKATYLGGSTLDFPREFSVDDIGRIYVMGQTWSTDFPITANAFDTQMLAGGDGFIAVLDSTLSTLEYGSYIGNSSASDFSEVTGAALGPCGQIAVTGGPAGGSWPTTPGAFDTTYGGASDIWVAMLDAFTPYEDVGGGVAGALGSVLLSGTGQTCEDESINLVVRRANPLAPATIVVGFSEISAPFKGGILVPAPDLLVGPFTSGPSGTFIVPAVWPADITPGLTFTIQAWINDAAAPANLSGSNALRIEAQ